MNTQRFGEAMLKLLLFLWFGLLLPSCNAHQQDREFKSYLCECNADGRHFQLISRNNYSIKRFLSPYLAQLYSYPFKIEHSAHGALFSFRDDGIFRYEFSGKWRDYLSDNAFRYRLTNYFHSSAQSDEYYFQGGTKLYRVPQDGSRQTLLHSNVISCTGIRFASHFSVLVQNGLLQMENGNLNQQAITLPTATARAYYFRQANLIVYLNDNKFWRCDADGNNATLLYSLNSSIMGYRCFYPIDDAGTFITTNRLEGDENMLLIDATDASVRDLGKVQFALLPNLEYAPFQISRSGDGSKLLYHDSTALYLYDLDSHQRETVLISGIDNYNLRNISSASINADGDIINFICDVYKYK